MTLPATGALSFADVTTLVGAGTPGYSPAMSWVKDNSIPVITDFNSLHGLNYYQNNKAGNCANGNCTNACGSGNIQCNNCTISGTVNCLNCDAKAYIQAGTNCTAAYNCTQATNVSYACNCVVCDCACTVCDCACACDCTVCDCACDCDCNCACDCG